jgi:hypothetical protein
MFRIIIALPKELRRSLFTQTTVQFPTHQQHKYRQQIGVGIEALRRSGRLYSTMSDLTVKLKAPNGREYEQPTGLFINNEWVKSSDGKKITSINPT